MANNSNNTNELIKIKNELTAIQKDIDNLFDDISEIKDMHKDSNKEIKETIKEINKSLEEIKGQAIFARGFIRSILTFSAVVAFAVTIYIRTLIKG